VVGQRQAGVEAPTPVHGHRRSVDDLQIGRIDVQGRADRRRGEAARGEARVAVGPPEPREQRTGDLAPASRHGVDALAIEADLQVEAAVPVNDAAHDHADSRGRQRREIDRELARREDRPGRPPLSGLVGALLRGPQGPVEAVPRRAGLEREAFRGREHAVGPPRVQDFEPRFRVVEVDDVVADAHAAAPRSAR
jgi:hypothetical protein